MIKILIFLAVIFIFWNQITGFLLPPFYSNMDRIMNSQPHDFELCAPFVEEVPPELGFTDCPWW